MIQESEPLEELRWLPPGAKLCRDCENLQVSGLPFEIEDTLAHLEASSKGCSFCQMRRDACKQLVGPQDLFRFKLVDSKIILNGRYPPVFSVFQEPGESRF